MSAVGDRIRKLREAAGLSRPELAEKAGLKSEAGIRNIEQGKTKEPKMAMINALARALGVDPSVLIDPSENGQHEPRKPGRPPKEKPAAPRGLPLLGVVGAGPAPEEEYAPGTSYDLVEHSPGCVAYRVRGTSMEDEDISDGDIIIVRRQPAANPGEKVVCYIHGQGTVVKKLDGRGFLVSCSKDRWQHKLTEHDVIFGVLNKIIKDR